MVAEFLAALLRANLAGGAGVLVVLALRKPAQRLVGANAAYRLWALAPLAAIAVLLPPRTFQSPALVSTTMVAGPALVGPAADARPAAPQSIAVTPVRLTGPAPLATADEFLAAWLLGVALNVGLLAFRQRRFAARVGRVRLGGQGVFVAERPGVGPAVVGALAPRVVVPADFEQRFSAEEQAVVLAHERAHLARQDARANGLVALAQCVCWFNPLAHLAGHFVRLDQELACDADVVARFPAARRRYAEALLKTQISVTPLPLGCYWPARAAHPLEERIAMLKTPAPGAARATAGFAATLAICLLGAVAAWASQPPQPVVTKVATFSALSTLRTAPRLTAVATAPTPAQAADLTAAGDWIGALKSPDLRIAIHVRAGDGGALGGVMDSPDQGAYDIPLATVTQTGDALSFSVPAIKGTWVGKWDDARHAWAGTWSQAGTKWALDLSTGVLPPAPKVTALDGAWDTKLAAGSGALRLGLNFRTDDHGTRGTLDSPDQNSYGLPLSAISRDGPTITIGLKAIGMTITGALDADGQTISGRFIQYGSDIPVVLTRRAPGAAPPYPPPHPLAQASKPPTVEVDPQILAAYAGVYRLAPGLEITVTADAGHLFAQVTNQPKLEVFASSPADFFWKQVDAQLSFASRTAPGPAPYVVLHQSGRYLLGQRE